MDHKSSRLIKFVISILCLGFVADLGVFFILAHTHPVHAISLDFYYSTCLGLEIHRLPHRFNHFPPIHPHRQTLRPQRLLPLTRQRQLTHLYLPILPAPLRPLYPQPPRLLTDYLLSILFMALLVYCRVPFTFL